MTRVAIIAAMAGELKPLVRGWRRESRAGVDLWHQHHGEGEWIAACAGIGVEGATRAFAEIEREGAIDFVISIGWAGALSEDLVAGRAYGVSEVIDARTGERFRAASQSGKCCLVTGQRVADQAEKRRLASTYGASLVDMEAAGVARLAGMRGVPFYCIKGVSDGVTEQLIDFNSFISTEGRFQRGHLVLFALFRPRCWAALIRMGEKSKKAARSIRESLVAVLDSLPT